MGDVERSTFISYDFIYRNIYQLLTPRIIPLLVLLSNCLYSAGVGKTDLLLRFADNLFSGMFSAVLGKAILTLWAYSAVLGRA